MLNLDKAQDNIGADIARSKTHFLPHEHLRDTTRRNWFKAIEVWPDLLPVLSFVLLSVVAVTWFRGADYIDSGDLAWPLDGVRFLHISSYAWDDYSLGYSAVRSLAALPFAVFYGLATHLGVSGPAFERMMFAIWFGCSGLSMYVLARVVRLSRHAAVAAGLFYALNTFALQVVWQVSHGLLMPFYAFLPLHVGLFVWCYRGRHGWRSAFLANLLLSLSTMDVAFNNPVFSIPLWGMAILWIAYDLVIGQLDFHMLRSAARFGICWCLMNAFWIVPFVLNLGQQFEVAAATGVGTTDAQTLRLNSVQLGEALRLTGLWTIHAGIGTDPYFPWASATLRSALVALGFISPILIVGALLRRTARRRDILPFWLLFLVGGYLCALPFTPDGAAVVSFLQAHAPGILRAFRLGELKFGFFLAVGAAVPFGLGLEGLFQLSRRLIGTIGGGICALGVSILVLGVLVFPFWTGDVIAVGGHEYLPSQRLRLPPAYSQLQSLTQHQREMQPGRLLSLPLPIYYVADYVWGRDTDDRIQGYIGADFLRWVSNIPVIDTVSLDQSGLLTALSRGIGSFASLDTLNRVWGLLNVQLVLLHQDVNPFWKGQMLTSDHAMMTLHNQLDGRLRNAGPFSLYSVPARYVVPQVYAPRQLLNSGMAPQQFVKILQRTNLSQLRLPAFVPFSASDPTHRRLSKYQQDLVRRALDSLKILTPMAPKNSKQAIDITPPASLSFRRVNPTEYDVTVRGSRDRPFLLVLDQQYDPGWQAYVVPAGQPEVSSVPCGQRAIVSVAAPEQQCLGEESFLSYQQLADGLRRPIPSAQHFPANMYANAWLITPKDAGSRSTFTIVLDYAPQRQFLIALAGSVLIMMMAILVLIPSSFRQVATFIQARRGWRTKWRL